MANDSIADAKRLTPYQAEVADELMATVWPRFSQNFENSEEKAREFVEACVLRVNPTAARAGGSRHD